MFPIEHSALYQLWLREQEEILKHKWVLSERAGREVDYNTTKWDWGWRHRRAWLAALRASGESTY
jgi:hypothetical protein